MICRTCKGTGKARLNAVESFATFIGMTLGVDVNIPSENKKKRKKMCPDCYGSGKVVNNGRR